VLRAGGDTAHSVKVPSQVGYSSVHRYAILRSQVCIFTVGKVKLGLRYRV
jgi:hypothetical protein